MSELDKLMELLSKMRGCSVTLRSTRKKASFVYQTMTLFGMMFARPRGPRNELAEFWGMGLPGK